jgi:uncharacterized repeat protein (TIGR01451 family)
VLLLGLSAAGTAGAAVSLSRTSGAVLYIDAGSSSPTLKASYVAYQVANDSSARSDVWVTIDGFTGGVVSLAPSAASTIHVGPMSANASTAVFFYLQATGTTASAQSHTIHVYNGKPDAGGVQLTSSSYSLTVSDTSEASANKVDSVSISSSTPTLGGSVIVTVNGHTGQIGSSKILYFTPSADLGFPANVFQLTSTSIAFAEAGCPSASLNCSTVTNTLLIPTASIPDTSDTPYVATYTFRAINTITSSTAVSPVGYISSGSPIKHTSTSSLASLPPIQPVSNTTTLSLSASPTSINGTSRTVTFTGTATNTGAAANLDDFVATLPSGASVVSGSTTFNGQAVDDPNVSGQTLTWANVFTVAASGSRNFVFQATMPAGDGTYATTLIAHVANAQLDTTLSTLDSSPASASVTEDATAPATTITSHPSDPSTSHTATFAFSANDAGATFECQLDSSGWSACTSPKAYVTIANGQHTFFVRATDLPGNVGTPASFTWTVDAPVDSTPPAVTIDTHPNDPTSSTSATLTFSANEDATFQCRLDDGSWAGCNGSSASYSSLSAGSHTFSVTGTDPSGNASSAVSFTWTIDTTAPAVSITAHPQALTSATGAAFSFTVDDGTATAECRLDSGTWASCPGDTASYSSLSAGAHTFAVRATDTAGNRGSDSFDWTVDATAPAASITSHPGDPTSATTAGFTFSADEEATFECKLDDADWASCTSPQSYSGLSEGEHTFQVRATDAAGNVSDPAIFTWTVDSRVPGVSITAHPDGLTSSTDASFTFTVDDPNATVECKLDSAGWASCTEGTVDYTSVPAGEHTFTVRATNTVGNTGASSFDWTIDTTAPSVAIDSHPDDPTTATTAVFAFSADETATFECKLDDGDWESCSGTASYTELGTGSHTFAVRGTDSAGNTSDPATYTWRVDTTAPAVVIDSHPDDPTNATGGSFTFSADEDATFECKLDAGPWEPCDSPHEITGLNPLTHTFQVRATDASGNVSNPAVFSWRIDTAGPAVTIDSHPDDPTAASAADFAFSADEAATFACRLDAGGWESCDGTTSYADLAEGSHAFAVTATDLAGNASDPATFTWSVDTTAPAVSITAHPDAITSATSASFAFAVDDGSASVECSVDDGAWEACAGSADLDGLGEGAHTFHVRATDDAGNTAADSFDWTVDTIAPAVTITSHPQDPSSIATAELSFVVDDAGAAVECLLDGGEWTACDDPTTYADLADGDHTFDVRAIDAAGNAGSDSFTWTVDTVAPSVAIDSHPDDPAAAPDAVFTFGADSEASFECRLDAGEWVACDSTASYSGLGDGEHTFEVRATDEVGNTSSTAAFAWTVDTTAPAVTIESHPDHPTNATDAAFGYSADQAATFACRLDGGEWHACDATVSYTGLADGDHAFLVAATDAAGNTSVPAGYDWTVDTAAPVVTITARPDDPTTSPTAHFEFSAGEEATFECRLDGGDWVSCTSPVDLGDVPAGDHLLEVRPTDPAGNSGEIVGVPWTVEDEPAPPDVPAAAITSHPDPRASHTDATFELSADQADATFVCRLDAGGWSVCTSPLGYTGLGDGDHSFEVKAVSPLGDAGPAASYSWTIDSTAPTLSLDQHPAQTTTDTVASFDFSANEAAAFECRLDGGDWTPCASPQRYRPLSVGAHEFSVRATDSVGNVSGAVSFAWQIRRADPAQEPKPDAGTTVAPTTSPGSSQPPPSVASYTGGPGAPKIVVTARSRAVIAVGQSVDMTVVVGNVGLAEATNVVVTIEVPDKATVESATLRGTRTVASAASAACTIAGQTVTCALGTLPVGTERDILLRLRARAAGEIVSEVAVHSSEQSAQQASARVKQRAMRCTIIGTPRNDVLHGTSHDDVICGLGGNDRIYGGGGSDRLIGGDGNDLLVGGAGRDVGVGGKGNDRIAGGPGPDVLYGGAGDDRLDGGGGRNFLYGGAGDDSLTGGASVDWFNGGPGRDRVTGRRETHDLGYYEIERRPPLTR